jgi:hypothetical protein
MTGQGPPRFQDPSGHELCKKLRIVLDRKVFRVIIFQGIEGMGIGGNDSFKFNPLKGLYILFPQRLKVEDVLPGEILEPSCAKVIQLFYLYLSPKARI